LETPRPGLPFAFFPELFAATSRSYRRVSACLEGALRGRAERPFARGCRSDRGRNWPNRKSVLSEGWGPYR
jgi:hypothetical protein